MTVGIVGLGLIGGSFAKAYTQAGHTVFAGDRDENVLGIAKIGGFIAGELTGENLAACELLLIALYPQAAIAWLREHAGQIGKNTLVMDTCGTKRQVCETCFTLAEEYGFTFVGGHPMAGTQFSGFKHSRATLFKGASMIIVPPRYDDMAFFARIKELLAPCGFGRVTVTDGARHDEMIAFTSQMAHVVSNAYIKSPTARAHKGFSAGSYKDLTRVAWLNEQMWTELFLENRDNLIRELDGFLDSVRAYRDAMAAGDANALRELLAEGRKIKEEVDRS
ncbi:MAG: prephenate dehydrogenase [Oscillospiraceae bacterium]|jgi:prephenate dehydrogenase|nr:prephenate dehydrogenase [Oscillospiraceae bacterium]